MGVLLAFLALPIVEIALFIVVGGWIGVAATLSLVLLGAICGLAVLRAQGAQALPRLRASLEARRDPSGLMAHSALLALAGVLLILPGFLTDALGGLLLLPPVRAAAIRRLGRGARTTFVFTEGGGAAARPRGPGGTEAIDADYEVLDDVPPAERGASGWTRRPN